MSEKAVIFLEHRYDHPPAAVWKALTDPAKVAQWWAPGDWRAEVGHRFTLDMGPFGKQTCEVVTVEPETTLKIKFAEGVLDTFITWKLAADGPGTLLTFTHEGFDMDSPQGRQAYEGMRPGWPKILERIAAVA